MRVAIWDLSKLTPAQQDITRRAIEAVEGFPWDLLKPKLLSTVGREHIPVEWADLSRWQQAATKAVQRSTQARGHEDLHHDQHEESVGHTHDHEEVVTGHWHVENDEGDTGHVLAAEVEGRQQALGLAWYSGKVSIDSSLESDPDLAIEVFLAEGAHMIDFFYMTDEMRSAILRAYHGGKTATEAGHLEDWFEEHGENDYWDWVGESFMSGFTKAFAPTVKTPLEPNQPWTHRTTPEIAAQIRNILVPVSRTPMGLWVGVPGRKLYHRPGCPSMHWSKREYVLSQEEVDQRKPCNLCDPE